MRKIKRPKIGQYVLVAKYSDKSPLDPWRVGFVTEIIIRENLVTCKIDTDIREWRNIWNITKEEGVAWLEAHLTKRAPDLKPACPTCKDTGSVDYPCPNCRTSKTASSR